MMIVIVLALQTTCAQPTDPSTVTSATRQALISACRQEIAANPRDLQAYETLSEALIFSPSERLKVLRAGLRVAPDHFSFQLNAGYCLTNLGHFHEVLSALKRAATLDSSGAADALAEAGLVAQTMNRHDEALDLFRQSLHRAPKVGSTWGYMARSLYAQHRYADAVQAWDRAETLSPHGFIDEGGDRNMYQRSRQLSFPGTGRPVETQTRSRALDSLAGSWSAELWSGFRLADSMTATRVSLTFEPKSKSNRLHGQLDFGIQLGADPVRALFGHSDECVSAMGGTLAYQVSPDTIEILLTPGAADCGLGARGHLSGNVFLGRWYEPQFSGVNAQGIIRMQRLVPKPP